MSIEMRAVDHPSVWRGPDLAARSDWIARLDAAALLQAITLEIANWAKAFELAGGKPE